MKELNILINKHFLSFKEALKYLNVSDSFLYKMTSARKITFFKPSGKLIYFKKEDLDKWLLQNKIKSVEETEQDLNNQLKNRGNGKSTD